MVGGRVRVPGVRVFRNVVGLALVVGVVVAVFGGGVVQAAPKPAFTVSSAPASVAAGSSGNSVVFSFVATDSVQTSVSVVVPGVASGSPWTAPQSGNAAGAGYVVATVGTCNTAQVGSVTGSAGGPWTILVNVKCSKGKTFTLTYGGGSGAKVTAATRAAAYVFTTQAKAGGSFLPLATQPVVTVTPGEAASLVVSGLVDGEAGTFQSPTVTAKDAFGNTAPGYRGTVHFSGSGPRIAYTQSNSLYPGFDRENRFLALPADYTFVAADGGTHTFPSAVRPIAAGAQTLTATDTATATIKGTQSVTIGPDEGFYDIDLLAPVLATSSYVQGLVPRTEMTVAAFDQWGNIATQIEGAVTMSYSADGDGGDLPAALNLVDGTASYDVTWPTSEAGNVIVNIRGRHGPELDPFGNLAKTFTREFEQIVQTFTLDAEVITLPSPTPGGAPYSTISIPSQNLVIQTPSLLVTKVEPILITGTLLLTMQGESTGGDGVSLQVSVSTPLSTSTGHITGGSLTTSTIPVGTHVEVRQAADVNVNTAGWIDVQSITPQGPVIIFDKPAESGTESLESLTTVFSVNLHGEGETDTIVVCDDPLKFWLPLAGACI